MNGSRVLPTSGLLELLDIDSKPLWTGENPAMILHRQLEAPLLADLLTLSEVDRVMLKKIMQSRTPDETFIQHLTSDAPHLDVLIAIKNFARSIGSDLANPMHGDPALVLYYAAIGSALVAFSNRISSLSEAGLEYGFRWCMNQPGAERLSRIMALAIQKL